MRSPRYDAVAELPVRNAVTVTIERQDRNGHLNIGHYLDIASWGVEYAFIAAGVPADWPDVEGLSTFSAEHHLVYLDEVHVGAEVSVRVRFLGCSSRAVHLQAYLLDDTHRRVAYTMELISLHIDMSTRRTTPWPPAIAASFAALVDEHAVLPWDAPVSGAMALR